MIYAVPKTNSLTTEDFAGADVACWINFPVQDGAEQLAQYYLDKEGWIVAQFREAQWVEAEDYPESDDNYKYVREAVKDGASFLIQAFEPNG